MSAPRGLRLMIFDRTCRGAHGLLGLSAAWRAGGTLYRALGRLDGFRGVAAWPEAIDWLVARAGDRSIAEIQFWGHGRWGRALIDGAPLDATALLAGHPLHERLVQLRSRLMPEAGSLIWFRTCETFGGQAGHDFARAFARFFGCRAAGHTHVIGVVQSGLHLLHPDEEPSWPLDEGVDPSRPDIGRPSRFGAPGTITCLHGHPRR